MQITGTITKVLPVKSGTNKKGATWKAQQYILEANDADKSAILLDVFGEKEINDFAITEGETITATFVPKVNEFNDRFYGKNCLTAVQRLQPTEA